MYWLSISVMAVSIIGIIICGIRVYYFRQQLAEMKHEPDWVRENNYKNMS